MNAKKLFRELRASLSDQAVGFGILVIVLVVVASIVSTMKTGIGGQCVAYGVNNATSYNSTGDYCMNATGGTWNAGFSATYNTSQAGLAGVIQFSNWLVIIAIVTVAGYLIFMVRGGAIQGAEYGGGAGGGGMLAYKGGAL